VDRAHVTEAVECELRASTVRNRQSGLAEAVAIGGGAALLASLGHAVVPFAGAAVGGALAGAGAYALAHRVLDDRVRAHVEDALVAELGARTIAPATPAAAAWEVWIPWEDLCDGREVEVPPVLPPPPEAGFRPTRLAKYVGQTRDWAHPLLDGARLHAHEWADGAVSVHRDRVDPARDPARAAVHWLAETPEGNGAAWVLAVAAAAALGWWVTS
jgi:hypothetical protein